MSVPLLYKPESAAEHLGIGRSKLFELIAAHEIETVQIGRSRRVPAQALEDYVARLRQQQTTAAGATRRQRRSPDSSAPPTPEAPGGPYMSKVPTTAAQAATGVSGGDPR